MNRVIIDKKDGTATVYNTEELALQALARNNAALPGRYTRFNFKPQNK